VRKHTRGLSGGKTESARLKIGNTADKWCDNSERGWKKEEREMD
jgi:hypothetical protein